jgi:hypothetical protein
MENESKNAKKKITKWIMWFLYWLKKYLLHLR